MPTVKPPSSTPPNKVYLKKKRALATTKPKKRAIPVGMHGVGAAPAAQVLPCMKLPGFEGMVSGIFDDADTNNDGKVDISEAYILILKLYININRQAPIAPPSRATADLLFRTSDNDDSGKLNKQEFTELASKLFGRAGLRVASYKIITVLVAPLLGALLASYLCASHARQMADATPGAVPLPAGLIEKGLALSRDIVPEISQEAIFSEGFLRTVLIVVLISKLGSAVLGAVDALLLMAAKKEDAKENAGEVVVPAELP